MVPCREREEKHAGGRKKGAGKCINSWVHLKKPFFYFTLRKCAPKYEIVSKGYLLCLETVTNMFIMGIMWDDNAGRADNSLRSVNSLKMFLLEVK